MPQSMPKQLNNAMKQYKLRFNKLVPFSQGWKGGNGLLQSIKDALSKNQPLPPDPEPKDPVTSIDS